VATTTLAGTGLGRRWIIDRGTSVHLTGRCDLFSELYTSSETIITAGGETLTSVGHGTIPLDTTDDELFDVWLTHVLYVHGCPFSLLSASRVGAAGGSILLEDSASTLRLPNGRRLPLTVDQGLFFIEPLDDVPRVATVSIAEQQKL
jgi:hypothetical protein